MRPHVVGADPLLLWAHPPTTLPHLTLPGHHVSSLLPRPTTLAPALRALALAAFPGDASSPDILLAPSSMSLFWCPFSRYPPQTSTLPPSLSLFLALHVSLVLLTTWHTYYTLIRCLVYYIVPPAPTIHLFRVNLLSQNLELCLTVTKHSIKLLNEWRCLPPHGQERKTRCHLMI